jgi:hypothetical protein
MISRKDAAVSYMEVSTRVMSKSLSFHLVWK